jgi:hypothetical protein
MSGNGINETAMQTSHQDEFNQAPMPRSVRLGLIAIVGGFVVFGVYLLSVRGTALMLDLAAMTANLFCM